MNNNEKTSPSITSYRSVNGRGRVSGVDFSTVAGRQLTFYEFYDWAGLKALQPLLARPPLSQEVEAITTVSGRPMLVMRGPVSQSAVLEILSTQGETQVAMAPPNAFDAWKVRSVLGFAGQGLQLASTFLRAGLAKKAGHGFWKNVDPSIFVFAAANLTANVINLVYHQGEQVDDQHQLRYLKQRVNRDLAPHLNASEMLDIDDKRQALRPHEEVNRPLDKARGFLKRHSVEVGELGLRYLGAVGLAYPATDWRSALAEKRMPKKNGAGLRVYAGLSSIFGKTVALTSAIPDPYNPKPATWLDHIREKISFLAGGLIEITSFSALAYDCFFNTKGKKNGFVIQGKPQRDWLGGIGASMFVSGYIVRLWAKFGERHVDMKELFAHTSDTLAHVSPEKLPQLMANSAASLAEHFEKGGGPLFASIYSGLVDDMSRHHATVMKAGAAAAQSPVEVLKHAPDSTIARDGVEWQGRVASAQDLARAS